MKQSLKIITEGLLLIPFFIVLATVFVVDNELVNGTVTGKHFGFYYVLAVSGFTVVPLLLIRKKAIRLGLIDLIMLLFTGWVVLRAGSYDIYSHTKLILLLLLFVLYIYFKVLLSQRHIYGFWLMVFFILTGAVEAIWGLRQLYGFDHSQHSLFRLTGSFFNPGPYSGYLALTVPAALYYILCDYKLLKRKFNLRMWLFYIRLAISFATVCSVILVLPASMSRAAWLACLAGCTFCIVCYYRNNKQIQTYIVNHKKLIAIGAICGFIIFSGLCAGMYFLKKDSADGRSLIWKTSLNVIKKNPYGVGLGNFSGAYGKEQANYFASGLGTEREEYVAGNPEYGFNEYLQIGIESGIVGLGLFLLLIVVVLWKGVKTKQVAAVSSLLSLLVFAGMSYPFSILPFLIVFVLLIAFIGSNSYSTEKIKISYKWSLLCLSILLCFVLVNVKIQQPVHDAYIKWGKSKMLYHSGIYSDAIDEYKELFPYLSDQINYLFEYAQSLSWSSQYEESNIVLEKAMQISCDPMLYNVMGKNYQAMKIYDKAEQSFLQASYIVPNRIYPYYLLTLMYIDSGEIEKAKEIAQVVLTKEPKVQSTAIREMKEEMQTLLNDN